MYLELTPKLVRWPTHLDHYLCRQLHSGIGIRSHAVTVSTSHPDTQLPGGHYFSMRFFIAQNLNGELCRTYCRIIDRMNGKITYTENMTPNFVRCGPNQARVSQ